MPRTPRGGTVGRPRQAVKKKPVTLLLSDEALEMLAELGCEFGLSRNKTAEHVIRGVASQGGGDPLAGLLGHAPPPA